MPTYRVYLAAMTFALTASAHAAPNDPPIAAPARAEVIDSLTRQMQAMYVFPEVAASVGKALVAKNAAGGYAAATTSREFAVLLSTDVRDLGKDAHLRVRFDPKFIAEAHTTDAPSAQEVARMHQEVLDDGFGIARVERLPGNVGYLDLRSFPPAEFIGNAYASAITLLSGTDAMIIDLRRNGGGDPTAVAYLMSHFFATGDNRHVNDIYYRPTNMTQQYWTTASVKQRYTNPVYVLTSSHTFSGGEECAYDFQTQKRATLVGDITGGGANPGDVVAIGHDLVAFIPTGRAINPVTNTNWEHVGVKPDVLVPAAQAQQVAYVDILKQLLAKASDPAQREDLRVVLAKAEKGDALDEPFPPARK